MGSFFCLLKIQFLVCKFSILIPYKELGGKKVFPKDFMFPSFLFAVIFLIRD